MKNLIIAVLTATALLCSCSKDETTSLTPSKNGFYTLQNEGISDVVISNKQGNQTVSYEVKDGRIILANSEDFENFLHILSTHNLDEWETSISFQSYRSTKQLDKRIAEFDFNSTDFVFDDLELASILNAEGVVQISPYLIKLDPVNQKVFVLDIQEVNEYENLFSATHATNTIQEFSFDDDVWYLLENNLSSEQGRSAEANSSAKKCNEQKSKNKRIIEFAPICDCGLTFWQELRIAIWYNKFGIWETVKAQLANNHYDVYMLYNGYYKDVNVHTGFVSYFLDERCGPNVSGVYQLPVGLEKNRIYDIRKSKNPLQRNKSSLTMHINFEYIVGPPQGIQTLNAKLNNF